MESKAKKSREVVGEVMMTEDGRVRKSGMFETKDEALDALYSYALGATRAFGETKSIKTFKDKSGVYGFDVTVKASDCRRKSNVRLERRVVKA